ncbi:hypothetical protein [Neptunomonas japonica]|jgi:hypothetical protein|uniref:Uncharacterized protein n=1 Tax=Neptunomonas japonica JAMM 1380 TaxID=1441457 RepID=A0A7R6SY07_9GAMM|nr:hypothetical protein [Neptunomonas japonica]BBB31232.1 conserved hypothetical protein [Neptunomonas japonica JAMM 1380]
MSEELKYVAVALLVLFAFVPVTLQALRRRKEQPPPLASNDRKLYRLWRSDPDAYQRQYGALDEKYIEAQKNKNK